MSLNEWCLHNLKDWDCTFHIHEPSSKLRRNWTKLTYFAYAWVGLTGYLEFVSSFSIQLVVRWNRSLVGTDWMITSAPGSVQIYTYLQLNNGKEKQLVLLFITQTKCFMKLLPIQVLWHGWCGWLLEWITGMFRQIQSLWNLHSISISPTH